MPAIFLHIQKTAGSSIVHAAAQHYDNSIVSHGECWGKSPESLEGVDFISGHVGYNYCRRYISKRYSFTFLRNPVDRVISMYYFCAVRDPHLYEIYKRANQLSFREFLIHAVSDPWIKKNIWNNQVWQLAHGYAHLDGRTIDDFGESELLELAIDHLSHFSYVGFTETFNDDYINIATDLEFQDNVCVPKVNVNPDRPSFNCISNEEIELIRDITSLDHELYDFAWNKLKKVK